MKYNIFAMKFACVVAGTESGVGKTTVSMGLISAFRRRGYEVQPFKVGPDFIDASLLMLSAGVSARNLDTFMMPEHAVIRSFSENSSEVNVVEGVMGLFDGASSAAGGKGSTAHIAKMLNIPVVLVVDASKMAGSVAALVHGFKTFDPSLRFAGVILNNVGSKKHGEMLEASLRGVARVFGAVPREDAVRIEERHLGLHMSHEIDRSVLDALSNLVEENLDIDALLEAISVEEKEAARESGGAVVEGVVEGVEVEGVRVGVAMDESFCFYYPENLEVMQDFGAEIVVFSPIRDALPDADAFYLGGGYPELYASHLEENASLREELVLAVNRGAPLYAECGGLLYCVERLAGRKMLGIFKGEAKLMKRLQAIGYVEAACVKDCLLFKKGERFKGHEFHYSTVNVASADFAYKLIKGVGIDRGRDGIFRGNALASYTHIHALGNEKAFLRFLQQAAK
ncbi:MAG: cobyrinate a,c-diamide synthase [Canidatus Methanoxibalbensis ujae]|nr:cobyrinate a,c-diamide synthase [Candidatus Methanoxibalbensis ujae]MCW7078978.1 cobyrinate a,c-diamide synthase [Candidatus Methanoxibalbensis ujae]